MANNKLETLAEEVFKAFPGVLLNIGQDDDGEDCILDFEGGKKLDSMFVYSVEVNAAGEYEVTVSGESAQDYVGGDTYEARKTRKYKTVRGVINFVAKWDRENAY